MKRAILINIPYLLNHSEEIINNTSVLSPRWLFSFLEFDENKKYRDIWKQMYQKHQRESGNWYIFGRGDPWIGPGETWDEAEDRIVREYCEATGHWDLFIWKEVEE
ncbi:MAG: hypothetical protein ACI389_02300 [Methanobrevibacter sp.]|uniref:hypothetical protein n=1 Tax=Methanobrevibacter sp. TaxID=66852 RepID=UPI003F08E11D